MNLADLAIKRPIFITCIFALTLVVGFLSLKKLAVDLFPNVTFPVVSITTVYPGAGPTEMENLVTKPMEDGFSTLTGLKTLRSICKEGVSIIIAEFTLETDIKYAQQQIRDRISGIKGKLPTDALEPLIRTFDPADQPITTVALSAKMPPAELFDLADESIRPLLEQIKDVGLVEVLGGRKREIQVLLDRAKLRAKNLSASQVAGRIAIAGKNVPAGKATSRDKEADVRTMGEFESLKDIEATLVNFFGNETAIRVGDVAKVTDTLKDEKTRTFVSGKQGLVLSVYRRSGANTVAVADAVMKRVGKINAEFKQRYPEFNLEVVVDGARPIRANLDDVTDSIVIGIILTVIVVFFFLGSARSTLITGIALPNSLLGAFILMSMSGFSINIMTLLAMSLAVGLLIDDAIVVRENIFRHIEMGKSPREAASKGTKEVTMAVVATTATVIAVFGPVAFLDGIVGQFFRQFGLTVCFIMAISLADALTMAPMLSAYFAGTGHNENPNIFGRMANWILAKFERVQVAMEKAYAKMLGLSLAYPKTTIASATAIFFLSFGALMKVPKTFIPPSDTGEFQIAFDTTPGTTLENMAETVGKIEASIRELPETKQTVLTVGGQNGEPNEATLFVQLVPSKKRTINTSEFKEKTRPILTQYPLLNSKIQDVGGPGGAQQPFQVNISGSELGEIEQVAKALFEKIKNHTALKDVDISYRSGSPELRVVLNKERAEQLGVSSTLVGQELRTQIEGNIPAEFRRNGREYDIRVRLQENQKNLRNNFGETFVPNINNRLIRLADVATARDNSGPSTIYRQDRGRYIQVTAGLNPKGGGIGQAISDVKRIFESKEIPLPPGVQYTFVGQAESFQELGKNMAIAAALAVLFIYLVLASLYESFLTPFTIMLVLPLAACGAFYALALTGASLDIFSMIGCIMLLGIATKNSILLVDYIKQMTDAGKAQKDAILEAGKTRLRPIVMTSFALIAGMLPIAIGLNEASKQRTSMGISVIGGLITSTLLTLLVVPAAYAYMERLRVWTSRLFSKVQGQNSKHGKQGDVDEVEKVA